jgi:hypothetical protein
MRYTFKGFWHTMPRKSSPSGDESFIYTVGYTMDDHETMTIVSDVAEIGVPGHVTNSDTDPFIMSNIMMRINVMWNKAKM